MATIDDLVIRLAADTEKLRRDLDQANRQLDAFRGKADQSLSAFERAFDRGSRAGLAFRDSLGGIRQSLSPLTAGLSALGVSLGAIGLVTAVKNALDFASKIQDMADRTGTGVEAIQELGHAFKLAGVEQATFESGLGKLARSIGDAAGGVDTSERLFRRLGVSVKDAGGNVRSTEAIIGDLADRFARIPDAASRAAIGADLFGREAGVKMANALREGSKGLQEAAEQARVLGLVLSADVVAQAEKTGDQVEILANIFQTQFTAGVLAGVDSLDKMAVETRDLAKDLGELTGSTLPLAIQGAAALARNLDLVVASAAGLIGLRLGAQLGASIGALFGPLGILVGGLGGGLIGAAATGLGTFFAVTDSGVPSVNRLTSALDEQLRRFSALRGAGGSALQQTADQLREQIGRDEQTLRQLRGTLAGLTGTNPNPPALPPIIANSSFGRGSAPPAVTNQAIEELTRQANQLEARLQAARAALAGMGTVPPPPPLLGLMSDQAQKLLDQLNRELELSGLVGVEREIRAKLLEAEVSATSSLGAEIERLVREIDDEKNKRAQLLALQKDTLQRWADEEAAVKATADAVLARKRAEVEARGATVQQIEKNELLVAALQKSEKEYRIVAKAVDLMATGMRDVDARALAEELEAGDAALQKLQDSTQFSKDLLLQPFKSAMANIQTAMAATFKNILSGNVNTWREAWGAMRNIALDVVSQVAAAMVTKGVIGLLTKAFGKSFMDSLASGDWLDGLFSGFAGGGLVTGPGGPTSDAIPARLSSGEFVVRADAVQRNLALLDALNAGWSLPDALAGLGRGNDALVAHLTMDEARLLRRRGGAGTINPFSGLIEFFDAAGAGIGDSPPGGPEPGAESQGGTPDSDQAAIDSFGADNMNAAMSQMDGRATSIGDDVADAINGMMGTAITTAGLESALTDLGVGLAAAIATAAFGPVAGLGVAIAGGVASGKGPGQIAGGIAGGALPGPLGIVGGFVGGRVGRAVDTATGGRDIVGSIDFSGLSTDRAIEGAPQDVGESVVRQIGAVIDAVETLGTVSAEQAVRIAETSEWLRLSVLALDPFRGELEKISDQARQSGKTLQESLTRVFEQADKEGLGAYARNEAAVLLGASAQTDIVARPEISELAKRVQTLRSTFAELGKTLASVTGNVSDADKANIGFVASLSSLKADFDKGVLRDLNEATGKGLANTVADLVQSRDALLADARLIGASADNINAMFGAKMNVALQNAGLSAADLRAALVALGVTATGTLDTITTSLTAIDAADQAAQSTRLVTRRIAGSASIRSALDPTYVADATDIFTATGIRLGSDDGGANAVVAQGVNRVLNALTGGAADIPAIEDLMNALTANSAFTPDQVNTIVSAAINRSENIKADNDRRAAGAQSDLTDIIDTQIATVEANTSALEGLGDALRAAADALLLDENLTILDPGGRLTEARRQFEDIAAKALGGDSEAIGQLDGISRAFLDASADYNSRATEAFAADFGRVQDVLKDAGAATDEQTEELRRQTDTLEEIRRAIVGGSIPGIGTRKFAAAGYEANIPANIEIAAFLSKRFAEDFGGGNLDRFLATASDADKAGVAAILRRHGQASRVGGALQGFAGGGFLASDMLGVAGETGRELIFGPAYVARPDVTAMMMGRANDDSAAALRAEVAILREQNAQLAGTVEHLTRVVSHGLNRIATAVMDGNDRVDDQTRQLRRAIGE